MPIEPKRGCGYRKVGGIYLVGSGIALPCDMLPIPIEPCPTCGYEIPFTRNFMWISKLWIIHQETNRHDKDKCQCPKSCPLCYPENYELDKYGLLWVGERYYKTPNDFIVEAQKMGIAKRIPKIPKDLVLGKTWVLLAHKRVDFVEKSTITRKKGIFYAFKPKRIEVLVWEDEVDKPSVQKLKEQGVTVIPVPRHMKEHAETGKVISWG